METREAFRRRRSCRDFDPRPIPAAMLDRVLDAASRAPAAGNTWALDLLVLSSGAPDADAAADPAAYWSVTLPEGPRRESFRWPGLLRAPVLVLPYVSPAAYVDRYAAPDKAASGLGVAQDAWPVPYWWVDGGAAVMAMLVAAADEGLGAAFFGQFDHEPALRERFGVPADRRALGTIALGTPASTATPASSRSRSASRGRRPLADAVHRGHW